MEKFKIDVFRREISEWADRKILCTTEETMAVSKAQAINNVRFRCRQNYGWRNHDEYNGSVEVRYEFVVHQISGEKIEQLSIFDFGDEG